MALSCKFFTIPILGCLIKSCQLSQAVLTIRYLYGQYWSRKKPSSDSSQDENDFLQDQNRVAFDPTPLRPGVNFMSQRLRGIPPGEILLLTLIETFTFFSFLGVNSAQLQSNSYLET